MEKISKIIQEYKFEFNDARAFLTILNVFCVMFFGKSVALISAIIAGIGLIKDFIVDRKINGIIMHFSNMCLYLYFFFEYFS